MEATTEYVNPAQELHWYAIHTRSRHEKAISARLQSQATETFLPLRRSRSTWKNGVHAEVDLPLFPCYLFARIDIHDRLRLLQTPGVLGFAASSTHPTSISNAEIALLRTATEQFEAEPHPHLSCGDRVRIVTGPLAGMEGILTRRKQSYRLVLCIEAIMRSISVEVSSYDVEPMEKTR